MKTEGQADCSIRLFWQSGKNFLRMPIESIIQERQEEYYYALSVVNMEGESTVIVEFTLEIICEMLRQLAENEEKQQNDSIEDKV